MGQDHHPSVETNHTLLRGSIFRVKVAALIARRTLSNALSPRERFANKGKLTTKSVIAFSETELWNGSDTQENWILTAGKIENLRIAIQKIHGVEVKANEVFSFWKHIGNPTKLRGYVVGREIREGCIVPTVAGGLCQLSNALYDAALKAGFNIIERHKHTHVIPGSLAEEDRDATVKWNYLDLQFSSSLSFRIEAELTSDMLIVTLRSDQKNIPSATVPFFPLLHSDQLNDCYSCGNVTCDKHQGESVKRNTIRSTTYVLDEMWDEYDDYLTNNVSTGDIVIVPFKSDSVLSTDRYKWSIHNCKDVRSFSKDATERAVRIRLGAKRGKNLFQLGITLDKQIAETVASEIPIESTHVVVSQNLLPFLFAAGALGGRTYDVLMTRLPMQILHEHLDVAAGIHPDNNYLRDFRAPQYLVDLENKALTRARKIITPHSLIAEVFKNKVEKLDWKMPQATVHTRHGTKILFPATGMPRKGALEMKRLAKELGLSLTIAGPLSKYPGFWEDVPVTEFNGSFDEIGLVVYPAFVEHHPQMLLKAIARGIPVITTNASGVEASERVTIIPPGDHEALREAVSQFTSSKS